MVWQANKAKSWFASLQASATLGNKYDRGQALIIEADELSGVTGLAATACSRIGAGIVTVMAQEAASIYRMSLTPQKNDKAERF